MRTLAQLGWFWSGCCARLSVTHTLTDSATVQDGDFARLAYVGLAFHVVKDACEVFDIADLRRHSLVASPSPPYSHTCDFPHR